MSFLAVVPFAAKNAKKNILRKTLALEFRLSGDTCTLTHTQKIGFVGRQKRILTMNAFAHINSSSKFFKLFFYIFSILILFLNSYGTCIRFALHSSSTLFKSKQVILVPACSLCINLDRLSVCVCVVECANDDEWQRNWTQNHKLTFSTQKGEGGVV